MSWQRRIFALFRAVGAREFFDRLRSAAGSTTADSGIRMCAIHVCLIIIVAFIMMIKLIFVMPLFVQISENIIIMHRPIIFLVKNWISYDMINPKY